MVRTVAVTVSNVRLTSATPVRTRRMSPVPNALLSAWAVSRIRSPIRRVISNPSREARVMMPRPPIWTRARITSSPKVDQWPAVSVTTSPVTHTDVVAVNRAVTKSDDSPDSVATGSMSSAVPAATTYPKAVTTILAGCRRLGRRRRGTDLSPLATIPPGVLTCVDADATPGGPTMAGRRCRRRPCRPPGPGSDLVLHPGVVGPGGVEAAGTVHPAIGVGAEVVALALDQGRRQPFGPQRVVVGQCRGETRCGDTQSYSGGHDRTPRVLGVLHGRAELAAGQQRGQCALRAVGGADVVEELRADDAAASPDGGHGAEVDVPAVLGAARLDLVEALCVRDDLRRVQRLFDVVGEAVGHAAAHRRSRAIRSGQTTCRATQVHVARQGPREGGFGDPGDGDAQFQAGLHGPAAGAFLLRLVGHDVHERFTRRRIGVGEHLRGDLDEVGVESPRVPGAEDLRYLGGFVAERAPKQVERLGDELHVGVLDAVVHHLHEMARAV